MQKRKGRRCTAIGLLLVFSMVICLAGKRKKKFAYDRFSRLNERERWEEINRMLESDKFVENSSCILKELYRKNGKYEPENMKVFKIKGSVALYYKGVLQARLMIPPYQRSQVKVKR